MAYENILFEIQNGVAKVVINRPKVLNALNSKTMDEIESVVENLEKNKEVRAVVVTGAGEKAFVAGADINELAVLDGPNGKAFAQRGQAIFSRLEELDKPVIAAVNGYALGGGCELALACHIRIASENAKFGLPEVSLGVIPGYGGTQRLPRLVGTSMALQMILTGEMISAREAYRVGLVNQVVPQGELMAAAEKMVETILSRSPFAVRRALFAVRYAQQVSFQQGLDIEANLFGEVCGSQDKSEGTRAFLEKRKPSFTGK